MSEITSEQTTNNLENEINKLLESKDGIGLYSSVYNNNSSSIKNEKSKGGIISSEKTQYQNAVYICEECMNFPIMRIYKDKIKICKGTKHEKEMGIQEYINSISKDSIKQNNDKDMNKYKLCKDHKDKTITKICVDCKQNLCDDCKHPTNHKIKEFKELDEEIQYLKDNLKKYADEHCNRKDTNVISNKNFSDALRSAEKKEEISEANFEKQLEQSTFLFHLITIIISNLKYPSYSHYENIKILYSIIGERLELTYGITDNNKDPKLKIRLFGKEFIEKNKNNCSLIINGEFEELKEEYQIPDKNTKLNAILLKENDNMTDMSYMFYDCENLLSISDESKWKTDIVVDLSYMFYNCVSLETLPKDLENLDTSSVKNMTYMLSGCKLLSELNVKKWKTDKLEDMGYLFNECEKLEHIYGISEWDTSKVENMCYLFSDCLKLQELKDIFKWKTSNVKDMSNMFNNCNGLESLSNSAGETWDTKNVTNMGYMFNGCKSLQKFPNNIFKKGENKWDTSKVQYMSYMFGDCETIEELPNDDIESWDTQNVLKMNNMFENCSALKKLPNVIRWDISKLDDIYEMIEGCDSLKEEELPDFSKWKDNKIVYKTGKRFEKFWK